jgi:hypothetical protein
MAIEHDETSAHAWADNPIESPPQCMELHGRVDHFVVSGEFVMLRQPVSHKIQYGNDDEQLLHASVGRILRIEHNPQTSCALVNPIFFPTGLRFFPLALPADPPRNRTYILFPMEVFWSN